MKALLLHVGVDHTTDNHRTIGISGPLFDGDTFEFIPILESTEDNDFLRKNAKKFVFSLLFQTGIYRKIGKGNGDV
jgi:hypothetical protein